MTAMISDSSPGARGRMTPRERPAGGEVVRGHEAEQKMIRDLLRRAQRGAGGVMLVDGEPGIGKSLLLRDAIDEAADQGFSLAAGAADPLGQAIPFFALRAALREPFAGLTADDPGRDLPDAAAWWIAQIRAHLEQRAAAAPVLVCLDDLHWASPATLAALRTLPRDLKRHPVAWLLARSSTSQRAADYLFGQLEKDGAARVTLAPLDQDAVAAMLTDAFGAPPDQALADLARGAAGNPSLVAELTGGLRDDHAVHVTGGRAVLASARLPQRIHRLAQQRLEGLSPQARQLLATAAVLGPAFRLEDAAEMLGQTPAMLLPAVEEAMDAAIMTAAEHAFTFRHQLLRRAVGEMIPPPARKALHRQYGEMLLGRGESAARAASHLLQAVRPGDPASLAGLDEATAQTLRSAPQTAAGLALRALELTPPGDPAALPRAVAAAEALTAAGRLDQAARLAGDLLAKPLPPAAEDRLRCALASVLCAGGQARAAAEQAQLVLARPQLPDGLRDQALTAHLQALTGLRDELASPVADTILAAPGQHDCHAAAAARLTRAVISWDSGQISDGLELLRDAARHGTGTSADARQVQPLLALAAALVDLRQLDEAEDILRAADSPALQDIPAAAAVSLLRGRIHLAAGGWLPPPPMAMQPWPSPGPPARTGTPRPRTACWPWSSCAAATWRPRPSTSPPVPPAARNSRTCTRAPKPPRPRRRSPKRATVRPPPSATSASAAPTWRPGPASCSATRLWRPGWLAPRWPRATAIWPTGPTAPPRPWRTPTRGSRRWLPPRPTAGAWPAATRAAWLKPPRSTPIRGPGPPPRKTLASCTAGEATGIRRSTT